LKVQDNIFIVIRPTNRYTYFMFIEFWASKAIG